MNELKQYMVEFEILFPNDPEFLELIPEQREKVNQLFHEGKLLSYSLNLERSRLWAIFSMNNESKLINVIDSLPLSRFMDYEYEELMFHNSLHMIPSISLN